MEFIEDWKEFARLHADLFTHFDGPKEPMLGLFADPPPLTSTPAHPTSASAPAKTSVSVPTKTLVEPTDKMPRDAAVPGFLLGLPFHVDDVAPFLQQRIDQQLATSAPPSRSQP